MSLLSRKILGLGAALALLASPALAQPYYGYGNDTPRYAAPPPHGYWWHERRQAEWRAHEWRGHEWREHAWRAREQREAWQHARWGD